jgi:hypothetical protein
MEGSSSKVGQNESIASHRFVPGPGCTEGDVTVKGHGAVLLGSRFGHGSRPVHRITHSTTTSRRPEGALQRIGLIGSGQQEVATRVHGPRGLFEKSLRVRKMLDHLRAVESEIDPVSNGKLEPTSAVVNETSSGLS